MDASQLPTPPLKPNRIQPLTPGNSLAPAQGGWAPGAWVPHFVGVLMGILAAVGAVVASGGALTPAVVIGAICTGAATGLGSALGVRSAGPRTP